MNPKTMATTSQDQGAIPIYHWGMKVQSTQIIKVPAIMGTSTFKDNQTTSQLNKITALISQVF